MRTHPTRHPAVPPAGRSASARIAPSLGNDLVVWQDSSAAGGGRLAMGRLRRIDRAQLRWRAAAIDEQLAAGSLPEGSRLRAVRAAMLVTPQARELLAGWWDGVLQRAADPRPQRYPQVPVDRAAVTAAAAHISALVAGLRGPGPVAARGVAAARLLLTDGGGPLYYPGAGDLGEAVRVAERHLHPLPDQLSPF